MDTEELLNKLDEVAAATMDIANRQDTFDAEMIDMRKLRHDFNDKVSGIIGVTQMNSDKHLQQAKESAEHVKTVQDLAEATNEMVMQHASHLFGEEDKDYPGLLKDNKSAKARLKTLEEHDEKDYAFKKLVKRYWKHAGLALAGIYIFANDTGLLLSIFK